MVIILVETENEQGQVHILQRVYFESFQIHQLAMMKFFIPKSFQTLVTSLQSVLVIIHSMFRLLQFFLQGNDASLNFSQPSMYSYR